MVRVNEHDKEPSLQVAIRAAPEPEDVLRELLREEGVGPGFRARERNGTARGPERRRLLRSSQELRSDVRIEGVSVVAQDVQIKDEVFINESMILPHRSIQQTIPNAGTIVM